MVVESIPSITNYLKNGVENFEHMATSNFENVRKLIQFYLEQFRKRDQILDQIKSATEEFEEKKRETLIYVLQKTWTAEFKFLLRLKNLDFKITEHFEKLKEIFIQSMVRKDRTSFIIKEMHKEMAIFILYVDLARKNIALEVLQLFQEILPQSLISHETWKEMVKKITYDLDYQSLKESKINKEIIPNKIRVIDKELQYLEDQIEKAKKGHPDFAYLLKHFFENYVIKCILSKRSIPQIQQLLN